MALLVFVYRFDHRFHVDHHSSSIMVVVIIVVFVLRQGVATLSYHCRFCGNSTVVVVGRTGHTHVNTPTAGHDGRCEGT
eukprot:scaffold8579_cov153-Amphora_coffeaeformis.AAC.1